MSTEETAVPGQDAAPAPKQQMSVQEFLAALPDAPTADQIAGWKLQAPNQRLEVFTPDGKRAFIVRGLAGLEYSMIQKQVSGMATGVADPDLEVQIATACKCVVWTNVGINGKLNDTLLRTGSAGLPSTLFTKITKLSDFMDPQQIDFLSAEL